MTDTEKVVSILNDLTGEDLSGKLDENIFANGLLDSMATVQLLLDLEDQFDVDVPVSEFDRNEWDTPNKIVAKVAALK